MIDLIDSRHLKLIGKNRNVDYAASDSSTWHRLSTFQITEIMLTKLLVYTNTLIRWHLNVLSHLFDGKKMAHYEKAQLISFMVQASHFIFKMSIRSKFALFNRSGKKMPGKENMWLYCDVCGGHLQNSEYPTDVHFQFNGISIQCEVNFPLCPSNRFVAIVLLEGELKMRGLSTLATRNRFILFFSVFFFSFLKITCFNCAVKILLKCVFYIYGKKKSLQKQIDRSKKCCK